ncbi:MAG TPA: hypothetical protein VH762_05320, partial [Gemmatimonadaceae bacterium]
MNRSTPARVIAFPAEKQNGADPAVERPLGRSDVPADRWEGIVRPYSAEDVKRLQSTVRVKHTLAEVGAARLWELLTSRDYVQALGALTGNQAVQQVRAGLEA